MAVTFADVTDVWIPQGDCIKIQETVGGRVLWEKKTTPVVDDYWILKAEGTFIDGGGPVYQYTNTNNTTNVIVNGGRLVYGKTLSLKVSVYDKDMKQIEFLDAGRWGVGYAAPQDKTNGMAYVKNRQLTSGVITCDIEPGYPDPSILTSRLNFMSYVYDRTNSAWPIGWEFGSFSVSLS